MEFLIVVTRNNLEVVLEQICFQWNKLRTAKDLRIRYQVADRYINSYQHASKKVDVRVRGA